MCAEPVRRCLLNALFVLLGCQSLANAAESSSAPILRINPGEHTAPIRSIATDKAGRWLVTASHDKTARVWDLGSDRLFGTLRIPIEPGHHGKLYAVAMSPDGQVIALGGLTDEDNAIYIFERSSGRLMRRLTEQSSAGSVSHLAFSPDGRSLAATLGVGGLLLFSVADGRLLAEDRDYERQTSVVDFSADGRLLTASHDGFLRLYRFDGKTLSLLSQRETAQPSARGQPVYGAQGGSMPSDARFSPDGKHIAVAFDDTGAVNVLSAVAQGVDQMAYEYSPNLVGVPERLSSVAWSQDGAMLYAGGQAAKLFAGRERFFVRQWSAAGKGAPVDWPVAGNTLMALIPLPGGRLAFGGAAPEWGVLDQSGNSQLLHGPVVADFRGEPERLRFATDGSKVRFSARQFGESPLVFDVHQRDYVAENTAGLAPPVMTRAGMDVANWKNTTAPLLNGAPLTLQTNETSRSMVQLPGGASFALGSDWWLRVFDSDRTPLWRQAAPGVAWLLNASADGRWVVAAYGDGSIRWYRASDGVEQLAFFPHPDKKRWIMWTPEGYYDASPGGEELIGWHLNQGKDKEARFIPNSQLYDVFYRPDIVQAKFRGEDISSLITLTAEQALKAPPPDVAITKLPVSSDVARDKVCYKITSTGGGIGEVRLFQNGKLVKSDGFYREAVGKRDERLTLSSVTSDTVTRSLRALKLSKSELPMAPSTIKGNVVEECQEIEPIAGENELVVVAFNAQNTVQSSMANGKFISSKMPDQSHLYVLAIGIDQFKDANANLKFAGKDAKDFQTIVREQTGKLFKPSNVHLQGLTSIQATKQDILNKIDELANQIKASDTFILFVASHGVMLGNQYYLVSAGYDGTVNPQNLIGSNEVVELSKMIKALNQLYVFDTCHAGGVDSIIGGLYDARMSVLAKKMGLHIYVAAGGLQEALDGYQGNGLFTHSLIDSLKDQTTDSDKDGKVSMMELGKAAKDRTTAISTKIGHPQTPTMIHFGKDVAVFGVQ